MNNKVCAALIVLLVSLDLATFKDLPEICPRIIERKRWGARDRKEIDYMCIPVKIIVIHSSFTPECFNEADCSDIIKTIQNFHMDVMDFHDIGYNFLVGGDGLIYEGTGWHKIGAHTKGYNSRALGLCFIGNFTGIPPNDKQLTSANVFIEYGKQMGEIDKDYKLFGARQISPTKNPRHRLLSRTYNIRKYSRNTC